MYEEDLTNATEIVLTRRRVRIAASSPRPPRTRPTGGLSSGGGSAGRAAAGAIRVANTVGAAMTGSRVLGSAEADLMLAVGLALAALSVVAFLWPPILAWPLALLGAWVGVSLLIRARHLHAEGKKKAGMEADPPPVAREGVEPEPRRGRDG